MKIHDPTNSNRPVALMLLLFFLLLLPILPEVSTYHSDEHYYTDSAVYMVQHNSFMTPYYTDGSLRTKKPILTYWLIIAGYSFLGINLFAARLPFLLAGCATLWLTYAMALKLFGKRRVAFLSAAILASNIQFMMLCLRATPDILQVLFMNVSLFGFMAIVFEKDFRHRNYILMYVGAALVVQTKGLLGVVVIGFIYAYYLIAGKKESPTGRITHWPVMVLAAAVALSWYGYMLVQHGGGALGGFYTDQIGGKISGSKLYILSNFKDYLLGVFRNFMPWSLFLAAGYIGCRKAVHDEVKQHRQAAVFIASWFGLLLAIFLGSSDCRTRYLVPAYPLLAILISGLFWRLMGIDANRKIWTGAGVLVLAFSGAVGLILLWIGSILQWRILAAGLILLGGSITAAYGWRRSRERFSPVVMGMVIMAVLAVPRGLVLPIFEFGPSKALSACILEAQPAGQPVTVWALRRANFLRQLYTLSQGRIMVRYFKRGDLPHHLDNRPLVVLSAAEKESYAADDYAIETCGAVFLAPPILTVWRAMISGDRSTVLESMQEPIFLARRKAGGP